MHPSKTSVGDAGARIHVGSSQVALGGNRHAAEDILIEAREPPPVARDEVGVNVLRAVDYHFSFDF